MRSMLLVLALSAPSLAFAAPNYTTAINNVPTTAKAKPQLVTVGFFNSTLDKCRVRIAGASYAVEPFQQIKIAITVGSTVTIDSEMNSRISQKMQASIADAGRQVLIQQAR